MARGAGKTDATTTPAKSSAKSTLSTGSTKKSCPVRPAKKAAVTGLHCFDLNLMVFSPLVNVPTSSLVSSIYISFLKAMFDIIKRLYGLRRCTSCEI